MTGKLRRVKEGTVVLIPVGRDEGPAPYTVHPKCDKDVGHWYCVTHSEAFPNQLQKDGHVNRGSHLLGWVCHVHGEIEVP